MHKLFPFLILFALVLASCSDPGTEEQVSNPDSKSSASISNLEDCNDEAASGKIKKALSLAVVMDMSDSEANAWLAIKDDKPQFGLQSFEVDTLFNQHCILSVKTGYEWMAAYPSGGERYFNFDKRTGNKLIAADVFDPAKMDVLIKECNDELQEIVKEGRKGLTAEDGLNDYNNIIADMNPVFTKENLNNFYLQDGTIVFVYEFGFPRYALTLEPACNITYSFPELKTYLKEGSPLMPLVGGL